MRIKKIELIGFKSFKDRTVIQFDAGITGIVGPNGCGKSNIVDALLWVMGEMSAKDLRGSSMVDVIFAGAEGFSPAGMAEVSLTLENDGGPFPVKYQKYSEVMVTRRLYRNGESEYAINKEAARLRDIQEIFMDTGAGSKGFSIIQQGMIGRIITSKPEDRRMLIEEAAGITKFKARKKESQRKLQATDQNLVRLADIIGELKRQIESLKRQAERAERFRNLKLQIEELDLKVASFHYHSLQSDVESTQARLISLQDQETTVETTLAERAAEVEQLRLELLEKEKELDWQSQNQSEKQVSVQKLELEMQRLEFDIEQARAKGEMTGSLIQVQKLRFETLLKEKDQLSTSLEELKTKVQNLESRYESQNELFLEQENRDQELDEQLTKVRRDLFALGQSESQVEARLAAGDSQAQEIQGRLQEAQLLEDELKLKETELKERFDNFSSQLVKAQEDALSLRSQVVEVEQNRKDHLIKIEESKKYWEANKAELGDVTTRLNALEDLSRNLEGFEEGVKQVMLWKKKQVQMHPEGGVTEFNTLSEMIEVPAQYESALEAALGHRLQVLLSSQNQDVLGAVDFLKENKKGRASFALPQGESDKRTSSETPSGIIGVLSQLIETPENLKEVVHKLVGQVAVVDTIKQAIEYRDQFPGWTFVTLEGDILSLDGVLTAGHSEGAESGLLKRRREIKELRFLQEEKSGKLALAQAQLNKLEEEKLELDKKLELVQLAALTQDTQVTETRKEHDRAEIELRNIKQSVERANRDFLRVQEQLNQLLLKNQELEGHKNEITQKKQNLESESYELQSELENLRLGFTSLRNEVTQLQIELSEKRANLNSLRQNLDRVTNELALVEIELSRMNAESEQAGDSLSHNQVLIEEKRRQFQNGVRELEELRQNLSLKRNEYEELSNKLQEVESEFLSLQSQSNQRLHQVNEAQIRFEQAKMKEQVLIEQIRERYMLNLPDVWQNSLQLDLDLLGTETQVKELKEKLGKIGEVNLSAIEEYKETSQRYEFLVNQQNDLIEAKDQLRKVIDRINRICSKRFKDTFDLVNERFTKVFPVLFGGGEARLDLVEDPDKGEVGIDIIAKPPGKKMQNVSLLSGGEKALTAVSLVFAIFLVKPSPYCLLDEVDAPLDDANVSRFNDLVREMAKRSQLIVVTHNKHTMEIAQKLYGVTMQNRGVSTMVSVNLSDL